MVVGAREVRPFFVVGACGLAATSAAQAAAPALTVQPSALRRPAQSLKPFLLRGAVENASAFTGAGKVTVRLMRSGTKPSIVGTAAVRVAARRRAGYGVKVAIPKGLSKGSYYLAACARTARARAC